MTLSKILKQTLFTHQKLLPDCVRTLQCLQIVRLSSSTGAVEPQSESSPARKLLKVAIVGRPNAGKSTLINAMLDLNLCGVSQKTHTTSTCFKAAFTKGDTQIVFVDTPGLVTRKECLRFNLTDSFTNWKEQTLNEADIIGLVHDVLVPQDVYRFHLNTLQNIHSFPENKPLFLILSKMDLVIDKEGLTAALEEVSLPEDLSRARLKNVSKVWNKFSRVFYTSATRNKGVQEVIDYLLENAKPGDWIFQPGQMYEKPLDVLVVDLLRAQLLDVLPNEVPYACKYEIEYMKENHLGEIICVALVTCKRARYARLITGGKKGSLRQITKNLEFDLFKIVNKVFRIRVVVVADTRPVENEKKKKEKE